MDQSQGTLQAGRWKGQHVVPRGKNWAVRKTGSDRVTRNHARKDEAIETARRFAKNQRATLYIHGCDGRIKKRESYAGNSQQAPNAL